MERRHSAPLLLACVLPVTALAQTPAATAPTAIEACVAIETAAERLACYDAVARRVAPSPQEADEAAAAAAAGWLRSRSRTRASSSSNRKGLAM